MIAISNLKLAPGADEAQLRVLAARALNVPPQDITGLRIRKKSLDARRKDDIHYVYTVGVTVRGTNGSSSAAAAAPRSCTTRPTPSSTSRRRRRAP